MPLTCREWGRLKIGEDGLALHRAGSGRGKWGGIRTICYHRADPAAVCLPMACATADREDMKPADRKGRSRLAAEIQRDEAKWAPNERRWVSRSKRH